MPYTYEYPRPSVTLDCVTLGVENEDIKVLLIKRGKEPFKGEYALPGGFLEMDESPGNGCLREMEEETSLKLKGLLQIGAFGEVNRDPRGRVISIAFLSVIKGAREVKGSSDAASARWFNLNSLPETAFDHREIIDKAIETLKLNLQNAGKGKWPSLSGDEISILRTRLGLNNK